jgi:hypothetical protein
MSNIIFTVDERGESTAKRHAIESKVPVLPGICLCKFQTQLMMVESP